MRSRLSPAIVRMFRTAREESRKNLIENMAVVFIFDEGGGERLAHRCPLEARRKDRIHRVDSFGDRYSHPRLAKLVYETEQLIAKRGHRSRILSRSAAGNRARFALDFRAIVFMLKQHAECGFDAIVVEFLDTETEQRARPVQSFGDRGRFLEAEFANRADESCGLGREALI